MQSAITFENHHTHTHTYAYMMYIRKTSCRNFDEITEEWWRQIREVNSINISHTHTLKNINSKEHSKEIENH